MSPDGVSRLSLPDRPEDDGLEMVVDHVVDGRVGIVHELYELPPETDAPQLFHYYSTACNTGQIGEMDNFRYNGGAAIDRRVALAKAMGESVERYCSALVTLPELPLSSYDDAPFPCLEPELFRTYTDAQYAEPGFDFVPFRRDTPVRWTPAIDCSTGESVHVPGACIWMPYYYLTDTGEQPIMQPISTGLACHRGLARAMLGGFSEVVERDSFTLMWQARLSRPHIRVETLSEANYELVRRFERVGHEVHLLDITTDLGIPVILAVARHERVGIPPVVFAASGAPDPEEAVRKALEELAHTRRYMAEIQGWPEPFDPGENYCNVVDQRAHLRFWGDRARAHLADFVTASDERIDFQALPNLAHPDPAVALCRLRDRITAAGFRCLAAELTTPDVADLGLAVVHCIVPGLHPFFIGHQRRARGNPRLYEVPPRLGLKPLAPGADNPLPHPYP